VFIPWQIAERLMNEDSRFECTVIPEYDYCFIRQVGKRPIAELYGRKLYPVRIVLEFYGHQIQLRKELACKEQIEDLPVNVYDMLEYIYITRGDEYE